MICRKLERCISRELKNVSLEECDNKNRNNCIESSDRRSSVKCEENKKKYVLQNTKKKHVILYKMDGGIIAEDSSVPPNTSKCDYLFVIGDDLMPWAILTELKGVDVSKALNQLKETLVLFKDVFRKFGHVYARAIVTSSTPKLKASPEYVTLELLIRRDYKGNIKIAERQLNEKDIDLS